jgi:hypothetical protein
VWELIKQLPVNSVVALTLTIASSEIWRRKMPQTDSGERGDERGMNLLGCLVRLFAWMPSRVSLDARSWSAGGACAVCAAVGRARAATPRPREDTAALPNISICRRPRTARPRRPLRTNRRLRAAWIAAGRRGTRARTRGGGGASPSSPSLGSQSESSAAVPARIGRGDPITTAVGRSPDAGGSAVCVVEKSGGVGAWWGRRGMEKK